MPQLFTDLDAEMDMTAANTMYSGSPFKSAGLPLEEWDIRQRLPEITEATVPGGVLMLNGRYDIAPDETMIAYFTEPKARVRWVTFEQSSHMAYFEEPERCLEVIRSFLQMQ
jgi:pimeloyl-ACP methyl ester carboxylesterase